MKVHILRHAEAIEAVDASTSLPDEWRYLTEKGCKVAESVAKRLAKQSKSSCLLLSSPLVRAVQTSQIVADKIGRKCRVEINGLLLPGTDVTEVVDFLHSLSDVENVLLIGHEPQLGELVATLLHREDNIQLKKAGCVELELSQGQSEKPAKFKSYILPGKKTVTSLKKAFGATAK